MKNLKIEKKNLFPHFIDCQLNSFLSATKLKSVFKGIEKKLNKNNFKFSLCWRFLIHRVIILIANVSLFNSSFWIFNEPYVNQLQWKKNAGYELTVHNGSITGVNTKKKQFKNFRTVKMTLSSINVLKHIKVKKLECPEIFNCHYYKVYKLAHRFNGSWPYQSIYEQFIVVFYEWSIGYFTFIGQVGKRDTWSLLLLLLLLFLLRFYLILLY